MKIEIVAQMNAQEHLGRLTGVNRKVFLQNLNDIGASLYLFGRGWVPKIELNI